MFARKPLSWLTLILLLATIIGVVYFFVYPQKMASAVPNPPTLLTAQPTVEAGPQPTRLSPNGTTVILENPDAPKMPPLSMPLEVHQSGVTVRLEALDLQEIAHGRVHAQVCFTLPSSSMDWSFGESWLETTMGKWPLIQGELLRYEKDAGGVMWRCDTLTFEAPDRPRITKPMLQRLVIAALSGPSLAKPDCSAAQKALASEGIQLAPIEGEGVGGCRVVSKPKGMSQEEVERRVASLLMPQQQGPWVFTLKP